VVFIVYTFKGFHFDLACYNPRSLFISCCKALDEKMAQNDPVYDNPYIAELYDELETQTSDIDMIRRCIGAMGPLKILEPFCGAGRILIPLALDGHEVVGMDVAAAMLSRARMKTAELDARIQDRITLYTADVVNSTWPRSFDLVVLAGNCLYELATPEEQLKVIHNAAGSLNRGGWLYADNDHMEGELDPSWREMGVQPGFPTGICSDGTRLESTRETVWHDVPKRLVRFVKRTKIIRPDGKEEILEFVQQKHPVSKGEVQDWLEENRFSIVQLFGGWDGTLYAEDSSRAIFWAQKM
jgi:SAM-dependent methyltransferase